MGVCISLMFDKELPDAEFDGDGKALAACIGPLDAIAQDHGIEVLSSFMCDPEAEAENLPQGQVMQERWYDSQDGLRTVLGLIKAREAPDGRARQKMEGGGLFTPLWRLLGVKSGMDGKWAVTVLSDLKDIERCLRIAVKNQANFLLLMG